MNSKNLHPLDKMISTDSPLNAEDKKILLDALEDAARKLLLNLSEKEHS